MGINTSGANMKSKTFHFVLLGIFFVLAVSAAGAADPWSGAKIMPQSIQLQVQVAGCTTGSVYQVSWPATVVKIEGQWLWIEEDGGCSSPPVAGWVSKEEVLKLDEANEFYLKSIEKFDQPWLHWFRGIVLEATQQPTAARAEYLAYLQLRPSDPDTSPQGVVDRDLQYLDAAMRLARLKANGAKKSADAVLAARLLHDLSDSALRGGIQRPQLAFEQGEALRKAYSLRSSKAESAEKIPVPAISVPGSSAVTPAEMCFQSADFFYQRMASPGGPEERRPCISCLKGYLGRGELYLDRVKILRNQVDQGIKDALRPDPRAPSKAASDAAAAENSGSEAGTSAGDDSAAAYQYDATRAEAYARMLKDFTRKLKKAPPGSSVVLQARALCALLSDAIASLQTAADSFDAALAISAEAIEAYRDRGTAYFERAQAESILADILDARADLKDWLVKLPGNAIAPEQLDRAFVNGQADFYSALRALKQDEEAIALADALRKDIASAEEALAKNSLASLIKPGKPPVQAGQNAGSDEFESAIRRITDVRTRARAMAGKENSPEKKVNDEKESPCAKVFEAERQARRHIADASTKMSLSVKTLQSSANLKAAESALHVVCLKQCFSGADELELLASIYSAQCNFERADYYQKLATIFAAEDDRPQVLDTLRYYEAQAALVLPKVPAKTPTQAGGSKSPAAGAAGDSGGGE
jgi:hypothetical protein